MSLTDSSARYGGITRAIHWLTALLILTAWPVGYYAHTLSTATQPDMDRVFALFSLHKTLGVAVVFVSILRILWALVQKRPGLINGDHKAEAIAAEVVHYLLYALLILVPVTGWIHHAAAPGFAPILWPWGQGFPFVTENPALSDLFTILHWTFAWTLAAVLVLHILGAVKHHAIDRDATLRRMWRGTPAEGSASQPSHLAPALGALVVLAVVVAGGLAIRPAPSDGPAAPQLAQAHSDWQVQDGGRLFIAVTQFGKTVEGSFDDWTAAISWNPDAPAGVAGHVTVTISVPTLTLGSVTKQALGDDFLAAEANPTATFDADLIKAEDGSQRAEGTLTLRGQSVPLSFPFDLTIDDTGLATAKAGFTLDRRDFGVGDTMPDEGTVAFAVTGGFELTAKRN